MRRNLQSVSVAPGASIAPRAFAVRRQSAANRRRRGAFLLVVMICLLGVTLLGAALIRLAVAQHQQARAQLRQVQAEWLALAALDRAEERLTSDRGYAGETWNVDAGELTDAAAVEIRIERASSGGEARLVTAVARYPADQPQRAQATARRRIPAQRPADAGGAPR